MAFDGAHALYHGDYVTPSSGPHAGQLGPWSQVVAALGLEPRGLTMKLVFLSLGGAWLVVLVVYALRAPRAWKGMLVCAVLSLWYLPFGTLLGLIQIAFLLSRRLRPRHAG